MANRNGAKMRNLVIGGGAWGEHYVDMLINYCLPSMFESISAVLLRRRVLLVVYTDDHKKIMASPIIKTLEYFGVHLGIYSVEDDVNTGEKYSILGKYQAKGLEIAKLAHADYHSLMPDHVYANQHFNGLMAAVERGHKAITRLCVSTVMETIEADLKSYREGDRLSVPDADLTAIALKNLHPRAELWSVRNETYPSIHVAMLEGKDSLSIFSPHQSILYIDRDEIRISPTHRPLDNELDFVISEDCPIYCPKVDDRMGLIEVTRANTVTGDKIPFTAASWCKKYWAVVDRRHLKYLSMETTDPINREMLDRPYMERVHFNYNRYVLKEILERTM